MAPDNAKKTTPEVLTKLTCGKCKREFAGERDLLTETTRWRMCAKGNLWFHCSCGATLTLPKGKYEFFSPAMAMSDKARSVFAKLQRREDIP
jgi:hypothetical protein